MNSSLVDGLPNTVRFLPWVGEEYWRLGPNQVKVLIIGESHYSGSKKSVAEDSPNRRLTCEGIELQFGDESWAYLTKVARTISPGVATPEAKKRFWSQVAFYNFVQEIVGVGPRVRPKPSDWKSARGPLEDVLDFLEPTHVLATGKELWNNLPEKWGASTTGAIRFEDRNWNLCEGSSRNERRFWATFVPHPSSRGYSPSRWNTLVSQFLALHPIR